MNDCHSKSEIASRFMQALQDAERTGQVAELTAFFAEDAELRNLSRHESRRGREGAQEFWGNYLTAFRQVRSTFTQVLEGQDHAVLEWTSEGLLPDEHPVCYRGVSLLQWRDGQVTRFHTYYDSAALVAVRQ